MEANELRIGNFVWDDYSGEMIVFGIVTGGINPRAELRKSERLPAGSYTVDKLQPIPLTEEWLLKFGYEQLLNGYDDPDKIEKDDGDFQWENEYVERSPRLIRANDVFFEDDYGVKIEYVHQLQNLFFALSGEELQIKVNE